MRKFLLPICFGIVLALPQATVNAQDTATIDGFQALFFNSNTGVFSEDMMTAKNPAWGNAPAEGFKSTFVTVKTSLPQNAAMPANPRLRLRAVQSGSMPFGTTRGKGQDRVIFDRTVPINLSSMEKGSFTGFWLQDTGCQTIKLVATLVGVAGAVAKSAELPFVCHE